MLIGRPCSALCKTQKFKHLRPCNTFRDTNKCPRGDTCKFGHYTPAGLAAYKSWKSTMDSRGVSRHQASLARAAATPQDREDVIDPADVERAYRA